MKITAQIRKGWHIFKFQEEYYDVDSGGSILTEPIAIVAHKVGMIKPVKNAQYWIDNCDDSPKNTI